MIYVVADSWRGNVFDVVEGQLFSASKSGMMVEYVVRVRSSDMPKIPSVTLDGGRLLSTLPRLATFGGA